jgi:hypothetical protein
MPYCSKCGKEIDGEAAFCPKCGTPTRSSEVVYRRNNGWEIGRFIALFFGGIIAFAGFGVLMGGVALTSSRGWITDSNGYINTRSIVLQTDTYALVQQNININIEPMMIWRPTTEDIVTLRINVKSSSPSEEIFIGIASAGDANSYLNNVKYDRLTNMNWGWERSPGVIDQPTYKRSSGTEQPVTPTSKNIWIKTAKGTGTQTLEWAPSSGDYWIVVMNANSSPGVDVTSQLGLKIPFLTGIGNILIGVGIFTLLIGIFVIYYGSIRRV